MVIRSIIGATALSLTLAAQAPLSIEDAIRQAWQGQSGLQAGEALVARAQAEAEGMKALRLPSLSAGAGFSRTDEPMMAFGWKLNQSRIGPSDFMPERLNRPDSVLGFGGSLTLSQPIYAGGRIQAARRAGQSMLTAEKALQSHRRQQVALAVVQAYFGSQVADQAERYAADTLRQALETERFVQARVDQGLLLKSEGERARAFRAQSEAGLAEARQRAASARSALGLFLGTGAVGAPLTTPLEAPVPEPSGQAGRRGDLAAARAQVEAAQAGLQAARGSLKPEVGLQLSAGTARYTWSGGGNWTSAGLGARWTFSFTDAHRVETARASARAAEYGLKWQEAQASREVDEARRALETARTRIAAAKVAVEASESVRSIRTARHREGLLPLLDVLDAEAGLSGARTLLLNSQLERRLSLAQLALSLGHPIEGVTE